MAQIARRSYAAFQRHPWVFDQDPAPPGGPNSLRHVEQWLAVAARTGLDLPAQFELVALVDDYVFGHAMRARGAHSRDSGAGAEERLEGLVAYLEALLETGEFPILAAWAGDDPRVGFARVAEMAADPGRFERGLRALLNGIELSVKG